MREIRYGLEEGLDVSRYTSMMYTARDMKRIRVKLLFGEYDDDPDSDGESLALSDNSKAVILRMLDHRDEYISFTNGRMLCWFSFPATRKKTDITQEVALGFLNKCGVRFGIDKKAIADMVKEKKTGQKYLVASGKEAVSGNDGYYEFFYGKTIDREITETESGKLDFSRLDEIVKVNVGDKVAVYHHATKGADGRDVFGKILLAKKGREIPILKGDGFMILNDRVTYVAKCTGVLTRNRSGIHIQKIMIIPEVNVTDKVIRYDGTVWVTGDVNSGSEIRASGDIIISGHMDSSFLVSGGNVSIKGGATCALRGGINAEGDVTARFLEGVKINAQNVYAASMVNCNVVARGVVRTYGSDGVIYGGTVQSLFGLETATLGSKGGVKTIVSLGTIDNVLNEYNTCQKEIAREQDELKTLTTEKERIDEMGVVPREMLQWKIRINAAVGVKNRVIQELQNKMKEMEEAINKGNDAKAVISEYIYQGVIFVICGVVHKMTSDKNVISPVTVKVDSNKESIMIY
jgi:uncharacterized protein (DUF342 family)